METLIWIGVFVAIACWLLYRRANSSPANKSAPRERQQPDDYASGERKITNSEPRDDTAAIEQRFQAVFAISSQVQRASIIEFYMTKYKCNRHVAMQRAIDDRNNDEQRL